jgi:hypothetical protein
METLGQDLATIGATGKYYFNPIYDPKNPVYWVTGLSILGKGGPRPAVGLGCTHFPEGYDAQVLLTSRLNDRRATQNEMNDVATIVLSQLRASEARARKRAQKNKK